MRLETIAVQLRRRSPWEALDLGHALLRNWAARVYGAWFATYWLVGIVLLLFWPWPGYALFVLWWLKPLFDRVLLHVFSRSVFGADCSVPGVLRQLPRLLHGPGVLSGLSLRRLSLARAFLLPVWQLEEQRAGAARARFRLLSWRYRGYAVWLSFFCANMSSVLLFAILFTLLALAPVDSPDLSFGEWFGEERATMQHVLSHLAFMLAETVVEPLYVASGFALYLNRRSELEAWDIELGLRQLAARRAATGAPMPAWLFFVLALSCPLLAPSPVRAEAMPRPVSAEVPRGAAREAIEAVLADPVFGQVKDDWRWRWRQEAASEAGRGGREGLEGLSSAIAFFAELLRGLVWIAAGLGLAVAVFLLVRHHQARAMAMAQTSAPFVSGRDCSPRALPVDVVAAVRVLLAQGKAIEALSLLYRGALVALVDRRQIEFAPGDAEDDCLRRIAGRLPEAAERCFAEVVEVWRRAAYGRQSVAVATVERLASAWELHFGKGAGR